VSAPLVLAVDGGNSKTDLALVRGDGHVLSLARGPGSSPHHVGLDGCVGVLDALLDEAVARAGLVRQDGPVADVALLLLAGADLPVEEQLLQETVATGNFARHAVVGNDTFAVLREGTERGWGVAVTCGAGINCVGVAPDGRRARFPALGPITGDWGGGHDVGLAGLTAAARSEDGRGPRTSLERALPAALGCASPNGLAEAIHLGRIEERRVVDLAPLVLAEADAGDAVAIGIVDRLAGEILAFTRVAIERLDLAAEAVEVVLGGGLLRSDRGRVRAAVAAGVGSIAPRAHVTVTSTAPIVGAALLGLDHLGAGDAARARLRREFAAVPYPQPDLVRPHDG
jgi:N-acetylglucosamine kinase-like BadF-type ATPase